MNFAQKLGILMGILLLGALFKDANASQGGYPTGGYQPYSPSYPPAHYEPLRPTQPYPPQSPYYVPPQQQQQQQPSYAALPLPPTSSIPVTDVNALLIEAYSTVKRNHENCKFWTECLKKDIKSLSDIMSRLDPRDPSYSTFQKLIAAVDEAADQQIPDVQQVIFRYLSPTRQQEYKNGLRILPTAGATPSYGRSVSAPTTSRVDQDDTITLVLQKVSNNHSRYDRCPSRQKCLESDKEEITRTMDSISPQDPVYNELANIKDTIIIFADSQIPDTLTVIKQRLPEQHRLNIERVEAKEKIDLQQKGGTTLPATREAVIQQQSVAPRYVQQRIIQNEPTPSARPVEKEGPEKHTIIDDIKEKTQKRAEDAGKEITEKLTQQLLGGLKQGLLGG